MTPRPSRTVQYRKWDGSLHWRHDMVLLGGDEHGTWLGARVGSVVQRGSEPPRSLGFAFVQLIRPDEPWTAIFNAPGAKYDVYIDLTTPARWVDDSTVELVDLDLDVVRHPSGAVALLDEDEWAEHRDRFGYPADLIDRTETAATELLASVGDGAEPFGTASSRWLDLVV